MALARYSRTQSLVSLFQELGSCRESRAEPGPSSWAELLCASTAAPGPSPSPGPLPGVERLSEPGVGALEQDLSRAGLQEKQGSSPSEYPLSPARCGQGIRVNSDGGAKLRGGSREWKGGSISHP